MLSNIIIYFISMIYLTQTQPSEDKATPSLLMAMLTGQNTSNLSIWLLGLDGLNLDFWELWWNDWRNYVTEIRDYFGAILILIVLFRFRMKLNLKCESPKLAWSLIYSVINRIHTKAKFIFLSLGLDHYLGSHTRGLILLSNIVSMLTRSLHMA